MTQSDTVIQMLKSQRYITVRQVETVPEINSATSAIRKAIKQLTSEGVKVGRDWGQNLANGKRFKTYGIVKQG
jgi:predicted transcriptional regulator of viral defense system